MATAKSKSKTTPAIGGNGLTAFTQHGVRFTGRSGTTQAVGDCPLCGKSGHFHVHVESHKWDCKHCGKSGGFQTFLREVVAASQAAFTGVAAAALARDRNVRLPTLRKLGIGFNKHTQRYVIPIYDTAGTRLQDVRLYKLGDKCISTATCAVGIFGWERIEDSDAVWLCEGEWDGCAMHEALFDAGLKNECACAVPGAGTFKAEWARFFERKRVNVLYDHDKAGSEGAIKVYNALKTIAADLRFIHWPDSYAQGFDVRDYYKTRSGAKLMPALRALLAPLPPGVDTSNVRRKQKRPIGEALKHTDVYAAYKKWLHLPDTTPIDVLFGTLIANRLEGDPLWLFLVAPSGGTKTEFLMSLSNLKDVLTTTSITPHSLVSGASFSSGGDPSLIPKLNNKVLIIKDFTTILNMNPMQRDEVFGILRDAYDGKTEKRFGNGVYRSYESKFGIIAGVTPAIELYTEDHTALGERFLRYCVPIKGSRRDFLRRAIQNVSNEVNMRKELRDCAERAVLHSIAGSADTIEVPPAIEDKLLHLSEWVSSMRGTVARDKYSKEITHKPFTELGTRIAKQLFKLLRGVCVFKGVQRATDDEYRTIRDVGVSTVPSRLEHALRGLYMQRAQAPHSVKDVSNMIGLPSFTCARVLESLRILDMVVPTNTKIGSNAEYTLSKNALDLVRGGEIY